MCEFLSLPHKMTATGVVTGRQTSFLICSKAGEKWLLQVFSKSIHFTLTHEPEHCDTQPKVKST